MRCARLILFACLALLCESRLAAAQRVTTDVCTLTATPSAVRYQMAHLDTTVSRDLLASLPRAGHYQHVDDDLALCLDAAEWSAAKMPAFSAAASPEYLGAVAQAVRRQEAFRQAAVRAEAEAAGLRRELAVARAEVEAAQRERAAALSHAEAAQAESAKLRERAEALQKKAEWLDRMKALIEEVWQ